MNKRRNVMCNKVFVHRLRQLAFFSDEELVLLAAGILKRVAHRLERHLDDASTVPMRRLQVRIRPVFAQLQCPGDLMPVAGSAEYR